MTIVVTTEADLRRIIREETRELREKLEAVTAPAADTTVIDLFTVDQVAVRCSVKTSTVRAWIHRGALAAHQAGRRYLVQRADLEAFLLREPKNTINPEQHLQLLKRRLGAGRSP
jgi:excisionase family DNA binding protein